MNLNDTKARVERMVAGSWATDAQWNALDNVARRLSLWNSASMTPCPRRDVIYRLTNAGWIDNDFELTALGFAAWIVQVDRQPHDREKMLQVAMDKIHARALEDDRVFMRWTPWAPAAV